MKRDKGGRPFATRHGSTAPIWSVASNNPLPPDIHTFIVIPGLFALLGFSVSLEIFAALQMESAEPQYNEDKLYVYNLESICG
jgi:hypothetical protein